jgi:DNA polymerase phi
VSWAALPSVELADTITSFDLARIESRRAWALDQMLALVRNGSVPKEDAWVGDVLDFVLVHGFFLVTKVNKKSACSAVSWAMVCFNSS